MEFAITTASYNKATLKFFSNVDESQLKANPRSLFLEGSKCLDREIMRQREKIDSLEACLPVLPSKESEDAPSFVSEPQPTELRY